MVRAVTLATSPTVSVLPSAAERRTMAPISSGVRRAWPVRTRCAPPASSPEGSAATELPMAAAISARVTSYCTRRIAGTSTETSGEAIPWIETRVIPAAKSRATNSSVNRASCSTATGPETMTFVTRSLQAERLTRASSASAGRVEMPSIASCTSCAARSISVPGSNSSVIWARPSLARDEVALTPSTAIRTGSTICTMAASTSAEPAPGQGTVTETLSTTISGKNCACIRGTATSPAASISTSSRFAAVRWRVK